MKTRNFEFLLALVLLAALSFAIGYETGTRHAASFVSQALEGGR